MFGHRSILMRRILLAVSTVAVLCLIGLPDIFSTTAADEIDPVREGKP